MLTLPYLGEKEADLLSVAVLVAGVELDVLHGGGVSVFRRTQTETPERKKKKR